MARRVVVLRNAVHCTVFAVPTVPADLSSVLRSADVMPVVTIIMRNAMRATLASMPPRILFLLLDETYLALRCCLSRGAVSCAFRFSGINVGSLIAFVVTKQVTVLRNTGCVTVFSIPVWMINPSSRVWIACKMTSAIISFNTVEVTVWTIPVSGAYFASIYSAFVMSHGVIPGHAVHSAVFAKPVWEAFFGSGALLTNIMTE
ncbi:hypothetical protein P5673_025609 [Acropora cervicornis]|uniref:Uncharacterized protein n=1 Tax=Acropora cervicornis TaxID=6130 RepID=A0AAD9Q1T1_ACRCE|nr:hypothetical protein P5673_025609 [Acropora cervicornis]